MQRKGDETSQHGLEAKQPTHSSPRSGFNHHQASWHPWATQTSFTMGESLLGGVQGRQMDIQQMFQTHMEQGQANQKHLLETANEQNRQLAALRTGDMTDIREITSKALTTSETAKTELNAPRARVTALEQGGLFTLCGICGVLMGYTFSSRPQESGNS